MFNIHMPTTLRVVLRSGHAFDVPVSSTEKFLSTLRQTASLAGEHRIHYEPPVWINVADIAAIFPVEWGAETSERSPEGTPGWAT